MSAEHKEPNYMGIWWWLLILTVLEVATTKLPAPKAIVVILLVGMALTKAAMVAMYFMHLRFEKKILAMIAITPLALCVFLALMLLPDSKDRRLAPAVPASTTGGEIAPPAPGAGGEGAAAPAGGEPAPAKTD